jgi:galactan 5-O-arabinofuranosyltransferase
MPEQQEPPVPAGEGATVDTLPTQRARDESPSPRHAQPAEFPTLRQRVIGVGLEVLTVVVILAAFLLSCLTLAENPLVRQGQVSALANIDLRFVIAGCGIVAATLVAERFGRPLVRLYARQMACAAVATLVTAIVGGAILFSLHGTPYGMFAGQGDFGWIAQWVAFYRRHGSWPSHHYPPLPLYVIKVLTQVTHQPVSMAVKPMEIIGVSLYGPVAYLGWRLLFKPVWALTIGVVASLPLIEPLKVYPQLTLVATIPVLIKFLVVAARSDRLTRRTALIAGAAFGVAIAFLYLSYTGWLVWAAAGVVVTYALVVPWRAAAIRALILAGTATGVFVLLTYPYLIGLFSSNGALSDTYQYFDTYTEPAYIAMWRNDAAADVGPVWPPLGELGNVGLFSVVLVAGLALALALGWRRTPVIACCALMAGAWLPRFYLAGLMYDTGKVTLYPRTTEFILYLLLAAVGLGIYHAAERLKGLSFGRASTDDDDVEPVRFRGFGDRTPIAVALVPLLLLFLFAGSATADRYMPANRPGTVGFYNWISQTTKLPDGSCPPFAPIASCPGVGN